MTLSSNKMRMMRMVALLLLFSTTTTVAKEKGHWVDGFVNPSIALPNTADNMTFPLVGLGVGNMPHEAIVDSIKEAIGRDYNSYRMIDTAHASHNEHLVLEGVEAAIEVATDSSQRSSEPIVVHVVSKVWYTYLGYERTKISVEESLDALDHPNIKVHMLLHWPRCRDDIPWMNCEHEEAALPEEVKKAGPAPHLDKAGAWKGSWEALEEFYNDGQLASIGVSNFEHEDMMQLFAIAKVKPAIYQGNSWQLLFQPDLHETFIRNQVHFQAYNVMNEFGRATPEKFPNVFKVLGEIAAYLSYVHEEQRQDEKENPREFTVPEILFASLMQTGVSIIPRTLHHLNENSPVAIGSIPPMTGQMIGAVHNCMRALFHKHDLENPKGKFHNAHKEESIDIYWVNEETGEEQEIHLNLGPGESIDQTSFPGHKFVAYSEDRTRRKEFEIEHSFGETFEYHLEL